MVPPAATGNPTGESDSQRRTILDRIRRELVEMQIDVPEDFGPQTHLSDDLALTSLDAVDLVLALEDAFSIELEDDDVADFERLRDVVDAVLRRAEAPS